MFRSLSRNQILALAVLTLSAIQVLVWNKEWWAMGGYAWSQGDWFINNAAGPVRRGVVGSALIALSDATGIQLLPLVLAIQAALSAAVYGAVIWAVLRLREVPDRLLLLLVSPAFLVFWANDFNTIGRKELLACLAFLPLLVSVYRGRPGIASLVASALIFVVAGVAHEANLFFLPFLLAAMHVIHGRTPLRRLSLAVMATLTLASAAIMLFALTHSRVADPAVVCAPLLTRGLAPQICEGAIRWLGYDVHYALGRTAKGFFSWRLPQFLLIYGMTLLPFWYFFEQSPDRKRIFTLAVVSGLVFLPLYFIAIDWGRWLNFHVMGLVFLILIYLRQENPEWARRPMDGKIRNMLLLLSMVTGISHLYGTPIGGFLLIPVKNHVAHAVFSGEMLDSVDTGNAAQNP